MDIIFIRGLVIPSIIGVYDWERYRLQKLVFDLDIGYYNNEKVGIYNNINVNDCYYIDYQKVTNCISILMSKNCFFLVESVAETVAMELILKFNLPWVRIKVTKIGAISKFVDVGVIIERGKRGDR